MQKIIAQLMTSQRAIWGKVGNTTSLLAIALFLMGITFSCQSEPANKEEVLTAETLADLEQITPLSEEEGARLLKQHCYSCHNPESTSHDDMLAPPLAGIKNKYQQLYPDRNVFMQRLATFTVTPTKENAVMRGPVRRFGLMPPVPLPLAEVQQLAAFIYDNDLPVPAWFPEHFEEQHGEAW
ncbi:c-type cytochrome [Lewinella cohaerens]|uniref:c-type cytochrome n=1 Tax=Lewinella cohaerens TaxID=70995 RepID=UPI0003A49833|nr:c-type cytochrome [Lewinella cohaerens]